MEERIVYNDLSCAQIKVTNKKDIFYQLLQPGQLFLNFFIKQIIAQWKQSNLKSDLQLYYSK